MNALIVDDSRAMRRILSGMLTEIGFDVVGSQPRQGGARASAGARRSGLGPTGAGRLEHARDERARAGAGGPADERFASMPLMMVTTETEMAQVLRALEAGAQRIRHEAVHQRGDRGEAAPPGLREVIAMARITCAGRRRRRRRPAAGDRRARRPNPTSRSVGTAANGRSRWRRSRRCTPDVVTLDIEMPEMDGLETLREIRKTYRAAGDHVQHADRARRGGDARRAGAGRDRLRDQAGQRRQRRRVACERQSASELIPQIKALCRQRAAGGAAAAGRDRPAAAARPRPPRPDASAARSSVDGSTIVAIGVSTGGPNALAELCRRCRRPAGAGRDRAAHAADVHAAAGGAAESQSQV